MKLGELGHELNGLTCSRRWGLAGVGTWRPVGASSRGVRGALRDWEAESRGTIDGKSTHVLSELMVSWESAMLPDEVFPLRSEGDGGGRMVRVWC